MSLMRLSFMVPGRITEDHGRLGRETGSCQDGLIRLYPLAVDMDYQRGLTSRGRSGPRYSLWQSTTDERRRGSS